MDGFEYTENDELINETELEDQNEDAENTAQVSDEIISFTQLYSIETIGLKLNNKSISVPDFQRKAGLWSSKNKSLFIESIILQLPIPSIVVYSDASKKLKVIDGLQRLSTLSAYLNDEFELQGLTQNKTKDLNGLKFSQLSETIKNQINNSTISVITVQCNPNDELAEATYYEIFRRLNQGGLVLTPQEIRNALFKGNFLNFLRGTDQNEGIRNNSIWKQLYSIRGNEKHNYSRERDVELLLRIFALSETSNDNIDSNLGDFLNKYLKIANKKSDDEILALKNAFEKSLSYIENNNIVSIFKQNKIKSIIWFNMLLSVLISFYIKNPNISILNKDFNILIKNKDSFPSVSSDTWNIGKIKKWKEIFETFIY